VVGIALPFYVYDLTHSVLATGAMFIASTLPGLVVGSVAGVFVDRGDRKRTMVVADLTRVALMLLLLAVRSRDTGWIVYLVAFVEARQLTAANALSSVGGNVVNIVGPTVGGALVVMGGLPGVVLVDSVSFEEVTLAVERARLVRLCARLTGDAGAAEDLAQETLLVAFQHEQALRDPAKRTQWLSGIARNLCLHWGRRKGLERARFAYPYPYDAAFPPDEADARTDDVDLEGDLERGELVDLLDRALALLPPDTRAALVQHYVHASPHARRAGDLAAARPGAGR